jgi:uncharacterized protein YukE
VAGAVCLAVSSAPAAEEEASDPARTRPAVEPLGAQQIEKAFAILRDYRPALAERLEKMRERSPRATTRVITRHAPWIREMLGLKARHPERYALRMRDLKLSDRGHALARRFRAAEADEEAKKLRARLEGVAEKQFRVRQELRRKQLEALAERLKRLRRQLKQRQGRREVLIRQRMEQFLADEATETAPATQPR